MALLLILVLAISGTVLTQTPPAENSSGKASYRFRYYVRDDSTGDVKGQTEVREGDDVRGSYAVAEPNGNTRVVTYTSGKDAGFKARVQVHLKNPALPPLPTNSPGLEYLMRIPPRNVQRSGFQRVEIKVVPPSTTTAPQVTQKPPYTPAEEELLRGQPLPNHSYSNQNYEQYNKQSDAPPHLTTQELPNHGYSEQHYEVFNSPTDIMKPVVQHGESNDTKMTSTENHNVQNIPCPASCDKTEEGRARIKQEGDQVQLEMEQVIRTEMKDPESINMGKPYQTGHFTTKPDNSGLYQNPQVLSRPEMPSDPQQQHHFTKPESGFPFPITPFRPDTMTPVYMKPLYLRTTNGPFTTPPHWPPLVTYGDRLYMPHIVVEKEDAPPDIFPSKVYLVPIPRPLAVAHDDLVSLAHTWDSRTPVPKDEQNVQYKQARPRPQPTFAYSPTLTYLLFPKDLRGK